MPLAVRAALKRSDLPAPPASLTITITQLLDGDGVLEVASISIIVAATPRFKFIAATL